MNERGKMSEAFPKLKGEFLYKGGLRRRVVIPFERAYNIPFRCIKMVLEILRLSVE